MHQTHPNRHVPVGPLLSYVEQVGGLIACPGLSGLVSTLEVDAEDARPGRETIAVKVRESTPEEDRLHSWAEVTLRRSRMRGWIGVFAADEFCITVLKRHPADIYGPQWWDLMDDMDLLDLSHVEDIIFAGHVGTTEELFAYIQATCDVSKCVAFRRAKDIDPLALAYLIHDSPPTRSLLPQIAGLVDTYIEERAA